MDILPFILDEDMVKEIPKDFLYQLAACSTNVVKDYVVQYLAKDDADKVAQGIIYDVYRNQIDVSQFLGDERTKEYVELLNTVDYATVGFNTDVDELKKIQLAIKYILEDNRAIPYIAPVSGDVVKVLRESLKGYLKEEPNNESVKKLHDKLMKYGNLFRDSQFSSYKGTIVKKVVKNSEKFSIISRGIEFILKNKEANAPVQSWRYL